MIHAIRLTTTRLLLSSPAFTLTLVAALALGLSVRVALDHAFGRSGGPCMANERLPDLLAAFVLMGAAAFAAGFPARGAVRVDSMIALCAE
ncbi:MAG TPA: hypothetical protein VK477_09245 [Acidobacteriota bacterium]|nr:hypothetical protein [Acidobacteriota bacterium]